MDDLFESIEEGRIEREAVMAESGVENAAEAAALDMHRCEVRSVIRQYFPDANAAKEYFALVDAKRGKEAGERLRVDCRAAWQAEINERRPRQIAVDRDKVQK